MIAKELYPFESRYLDRGAYRLHYVDEGKGEPLVMVHGNPTWSFYYREMIKGLRGECRVVALDHAGCGLSDVPSEADYPYTLRARVDDLEALLDGMGLNENVTLMVHDWGGMIGLACAARKPARIRRLVVTNTAGFRLPADKAFPWQLTLARSPLGALLVRGFNLFCRGALRTCAVRRRLPAEVRAGYLAPYDSWSNRIAVHRFVTDIPLRPGDPGFEIVEEVERALDVLGRLPVLVCWGMRDFVFDEAFLREWRRRWPEAQYHVFYDAGHYLLEDAGEEVLSLVRSFLKRHPL